MKSNIVTQTHKEEVSLKKVLLTRQNLYSFILFLLVNLWAFTFKDFHLCEVVPEYFKALLGVPPPAFLVSISLVGYFFAAMILTFAAIHKNLEPHAKWDHLGYRIAFFAFYSMSGTIAPNFLPVFLVGLLLYSLDQYQIWAYNFVVYLIFVEPTTIHSITGCGL